MKFKPGIVSVTFRDLTPEQVLSAAVQAGLTAVEWGGDVHVPAGDPATAAAVADATRAAGLAVTEYGSYYKIGHTDPAAIDGVVACARELGVTLIRVWAYRKNKASCTAEEYAAAVADAQRICDVAPDMTFALECHIRSLTEEYHDALTFLSDVDRPNFKMFWQPNQFCTHEYNMEALLALLPYVQAVHVFSWESRDGEAVFYPLAHHTQRWQDYIRILRTAPAEEIPMMLEFMHDGKPESLPETAATRAEKSPAAKLFAAALISRRGWVSRFVEL